MLSKGDSIKLILGTLVILLIAGGIWFKHDSNEKNISKARKERYEKMVDEEGKFKLTQKILDEDYDNFVSDIKREEKFSRELFAVFIVSLILVIILAFVHYFGLTNNIPEMVARLASWTMLAAFGTAFIFCVMFIFNGRFEDLIGRDVYNLKYDFYEVKIKAKTTQTEHRTEKDDDGNVSKKTIYTYQLILEDGSIDVSKDIYDCVKKFGEYYIGKTGKDDVFSVYPATEFEY